MAFDVKYIIELIDNFTPAAKKISKSTDAISKKIHHMENRIRNANKQFTDFGKKLSTHVSLPLGAAAAIAIHATASFEKSMVKVQSVTKATDQQMNALRKSTLALAAKGIISPDDIAEAEQTMSRFGLSLDQIKTAIGPTMRFAIANATDGIVDLNSATLIGMRIVRGYGKKISEVPKLYGNITDVAHEAAISLADFYQQAKFADIVLSSAKVPFEDAVALFGLFAKRGVVAGQAGRGMRQLMKSLKQPTGEFAHLLKMVNVQFYNSRGRFLGFAHAIKVLRENFQDIPGMQQNALMLAKAMIDSQKGQFEGLVDIQKDSTLMQKFYEDQVKSLSGSLGKLNNSIKALSISLVESQRGPLQHIIDSISAFIAKGLSMSDTTKSIITGIIGFGIALGPVIYSIGKFALIFVLLGEKIPLIGNLLAGLSLGFEVLWGAILGPIGIIIGLIAALSVGLYELYKHFKIVRKVVDYLATSFKNLIMNQINHLINAFKSIGHAFSWLYKMIHGKPLKIDAGVTGGITSYGGVGTIGQQSVYSSLDVNVFDPKGYIKSVSGKSQADDFNVALGANMAYSR